MIVTAWDVGSYLIMFFNVQEFIILQRKWALSWIVKKVKEKSMDKISEKVIVERKGIRNGQLII